MGCCCSSSTSHKGAGPPYEVEPLAADNALKTSAPPAQEQYDVEYDLSMLLHEDDTLTPEGEKILDSLFDRFDEDKDGAWNFAELRRPLRCCT